MALNTTLELRKVKFKNNFANSGHSTRYWKNKLKGTRN